MKTRILTVVFAFALVVASAGAFAAKPQSFMNFHTNEGTFQLPVKVEEPTDSLPEVVKLAILSQKVESPVCLTFIKFDVSAITKPEPDADDVVIDTKKIFEELRYREIANK